jgi:hypothetical protein
MTLSIPATAIIRKLLQKEASARLGGGPNGSEDVRKHVFFRKFDWQRLQARSLPAPFLPTLRNGRDFSFFDPQFTKAAPSLTPCLQLCFFFKFVFVSDV